MSEDLPLKTGTVIGTFNTKNNREVTFRTPRWEDLDDFLELINSLVEEGADIYFDKKLTREEETEWLAKLLTNIERDTTRSIVAEIDGKMIGQADVGRKRYRQRHVGSIGVTVHNGFRDIGIGSDLLKEIETQAKQMSLEILTLDVASSNSRARHVYEKLGYRETDEIPKGLIKDEERVDIIQMAKEI